MKKSILLCIIVSLIPITFLAQESYLFFELKDAGYSGVDSVKIHSRNINEFENFIKIPQKKRVKFLIFKNGKKSKLKLKTIYLDAFNTIESIDTSKTKINELSVLKGSTNVILKSKSRKPPHIKMKIKVHKRIVNNDKFYTGSKSFDIAIENNPDFFIYK